MPNAFAVILENRLKIILEESGRSSGKSTTNNSIAISLMLKSRKNNIWQARAESGDLRNTSFTAMLSAINESGYAMFFKTSLNPLQITCILTGAVCYFTGINGKTADDLTATKGFEPQGKTLAMFIVDEANEIKNGEHLTAAQSTAMKFMNSDGTIIYAYNPHIKRNHWSHGYFNNLLESNSDELIVQKIYTTWEDVEDLLKETTVRDIKRMRDKDPIHYEFVYLGQPITSAGRVIYAFDRERNVITLPELQARIRRNMNYQPIRMFYGIDSGLKRDRTAVVAWGLYPDGMLLRLYVMYLDTSKRQGGIPHSEQAIKMLQWYSEMRQVLASYGIVLPSPNMERWCFDGAAITQDLMLEWRKLTHFDSVAVTNKDIERDYARLNNSYESGLLQHLKIEVNEPALEEIETFCRDENQDIPEGQADHIIDADKYATYEFYYAFV